MTQEEFHIGHLKELLEQKPLLKRSLYYLSLLGIVTLLSYFLWQSMPRPSRLKVSGGELIDNRHFLAKVLQEEGAANSLSIEIVSTKGSLDAMNAIDKGSLDIAFVQGGLDFSRYSNARHVASLDPEQLQILARDSIQSVHDLKGKVINLGSKSDGARVIARKVLAFSGLDESSDYGETNLTAEEIVNRKPKNLPDAIAVVSYAPSFLVDLLVKERGYKVLEIPFPPSLALREGWVATETLLAFTYSVDPPVPANDLKTVGVRSHIVASKNVDQRAIFRLLETIYSPSYAAKVRLKLNEMAITEPSGLEFSAGTLAFIKRNDPLISMETWNSIQTLLGALMALGSSLVLVIKWFKGAPPKRSTHDEEFKNLIQKVLILEERLLLSRRRDLLSHKVLFKTQEQLSRIKAFAFKRYPEAILDDEALFDRLLKTIEDARLDILSYHLEMAFPSAHHDSPDSSLPPLDKEAAS